MQKISYTENCQPSNNIIKTVAERKNEKNNSNNLEISAFRFLAKRNILSPFGATAIGSENSDCNL